MPFPQTFHTARMNAERLRAEHRDAIHMMHQNAAQMAMLGGIRDNAQTDDYMAKNLKHWDDFGFGIWLLRDRATSAVAGRGLLRHLTIDGIDEVEVGYGFQPEYWGKGIATEIAAACLEHGKTHLGLTTVVALTRPDNIASQRVMEKIGMVYDRTIDHADGAHVIFRIRWDGG